VAEAVGAVAAAGREVATSDAAAALLGLRPTVGSGVRRP
jgi:hypothetical protein